MLYEAVGATATHHTPPYPATHNLGTCRMSERPEDGVVDRWGEAHDVPDGLYVGRLQAGVHRRTIKLVRLR